MGAVLLFFDLVADEWLSSCLRFLRSGEEVLNGRWDVMEGRTMLNVALHRSLLAPIDCLVPFVEHTVRDSW